MNKFSFLNAPYYNLRMYMYCDLTTSEQSHKKVNVAHTFSGLTASFRGRPLNGQKMNVPEGYTGEKFVCF